MASYRLTFGASLLAALVNAVFGLLVAWVLVRYSFRARRSSMRWWTCPLHCPPPWPAFRSPRCWPAMAGSASTWSPMASSWPSTRNGVVIALIFIGLPFVVRTVQPVLEDAEKELEEAATCLGATRLQTFHQSDPAAHPAGAADRFCHGLCARDR
jgi:sulfate transport system permease protein